MCTIFRMKFTEKIGIIDVMILRFFLVTILSRDLIFIS
jgi:hypothetical protein